MDPLVGKIIEDTYRIIGVPGKGGFGMVYKAEDTMMEKNAISASGALQKEALVTLTRLGKTQ